MIKSITLTCISIAIAILACTAQNNKPSPDKENMKWRHNELIDIYRIEAARQINANWQYSPPPAEENQRLMASLVFKVMPDGEIRDIYFIDRSGNEYFDDSAYKAVMKTNPLPPHPEGVTQEFISIGLRFTPEGMQ